MKKKAEESHKSILKLNYGNSEDLIPIYHEFADTLIYKENKIM